MVCGTGLGIPDTRRVRGWDNKLKPVRYWVRVWGYVEEWGKELERQYPYSTRPITMSRKYYCPTFLGRKGIACSNFY